RAGVLVVNVLDRLEDGAALVLEPVAEELDVERAHAVSSSRRSASAASRPSSSTTLSRPTWPATTVRRVFGTPSRSESSRRTASFARPRSGAAVTLTCQASPRRPTISLRDAPGETRSLRRVGEEATSQV